MTSRLLLVLLSVATLLMSGCAAVNAPPADPFERVNRATYEFNDVVDKALLKPVAKGYQAVTPQFLRTGVSNVFSNIGDVATALNNLLQGKPGDAVNDVGRVLINSTVGLLGLIDVASPAGLEKHNEDFGQTLGKWGVPSGPFLVLPIMGPSTLRDGPARFVDSYAGYFRYVDHIPTRNSVFAVEIVDIRSNLLGASSTLDAAALDKYQFVRDAYLQRRLNQVHDGKVTQAMKDKLEEDLEPPASASPPAKVPAPDAK
jgi:phospholipid-binding lipoprotein MlaA